jgi:ribosomal protein S18 acetylase RimI-like enzyme
MPDLEPLLAFWRAQDAAFDRVDPAWWGAVVSDPRFPAIQEPNYARVETRQPVALAEVEEPLLAALRRSGARREHVVVFFPEDQADLLVSASTRGERLSWDLVMEHRGPVVSPDAPPSVEEAGELDAAFWRRWRASLALFDVHRPATIDQIEAMERDVLIPAGRRWFVSRDDGAIVAFTALWVLEGVGYLDHVATFPEARRRGLASALTMRAVAEAYASGAERVHLLADPEGTASRLYARLGFRPVTRLASWLRALDPDDDGTD